MNIRCLEPHIIINKSYHINKVDYSKGWKLIIRDRECLYVPYPKQAKITADDIDSCYYLNTNTGEMIPVYLQVPCQKCILCRDKKAVDWATRITCEGNYHVNCPWWITLTYNNDYLPHQGLVKRDLQNFLKRLRERVSRQIGEDIRLRFVAVGEYGGNTARPHYHAIIYGMPTMDPKEVLNIIELSWSKRLSFNSYIKTVSKYGSLGKDYTFVRDDINGKPLYYHRLGFAYVKPAHDNTPLYLAKYMFKPELNTPEGSNPNFCLASRKNGIGYEYCVEYRDYHRLNPYQTSIEFFNVHTNKLSHFTIPQYFKDYWFPTPSKIIPNEVKKSHDHLSMLVVQFNTIQNLLQKSDIDISTDVSTMVKDINVKYPFYRKIGKCISDDYMEDLCTIYKSVYKDEIPSVYNESFETYLKKELLHNYCKIMIEYEYCMSLQFDTQALIDTLQLKDKYKGAVVQKYINKPPVDINHEVYKLQKERIKRKSKDMY